MNDPIPKQSIGLTGPGSPLADKQWWLFWNSLGSGGATGPYIRTLLLKDTSVGNDIADHVPVFVAGTFTRIIGVLRKAIVSDLTVRVNLDGATLITLTIPVATAVDVPVTSEAFTPTGLTDLQILSWDVTASDSSRDAAGIASFTVQFD